EGAEIDPAINALGRRTPPDRPYDDSRVSIHIDDGRSFLRRTTRSYDLVSYAVVDSLVLQSGYSSLRLESFLFTEQAFRDVKARLKPDGVFAMYNIYRQGWVVGRLVKLAERVFGAKPLVLSLPYQPQISSQHNQGSRLALLLIGNDPSGRVAGIADRFRNSGFFWVNEKPRQNESINAFGPQPPRLDAESTAGWLKIGPAEVDASGIQWLPTDDW